MILPRIFTHSIHLGCSRIDRSIWRDDSLATVSSPLSEILAVRLHSLMRIVCLEVTDPLAQLDRSSLGFSKRGHTSDRQRIDTRIRSSGALQVVAYILRFHQVRSASVEVAADHAEVDDANLLSRRAG